MNKVYIRLKCLSNNRVYEVIFDKRLSFKENLGLLSKIIGINLEDKYVYDYKRNLFLNMEMPIDRFNIGIFPMFELL